MSVEDFLAILYANRDLLGDCSELAVPEDTHCMSAHKGCPLRAAMVVHCPVVLQWKQLFMTEKGRPVAINPDPQEAGDLLGLDFFFTQALADAWDGFVYLDAEADDDWRKQFAGALIGITLRTPLLELTA
jgi:hypothetical protein